MDSKAQAVANLMVQTPTDIHYIEWSDLKPILQNYPVFREDFVARMVFSYQIAGDYIMEVREYQHPRKLSFTLCEKCN